MKIDKLREKIYASGLKYKKIPKKDIIHNDFSLRDELILNCFKGNNFLPKKIENEIKNVIKNTNMNMNNMNSEMVSCKCYKHIPTNCNLYYIGIKSGNQNILEDTKKSYQFLSLMARMKYIWCGNDIKNPINLVYWSINNPKVFPEKGKILGVEDVNSAVTYLYNNKIIKYGDIYIYRTEEAPKIIVHEMIHALGLDRQLFDSKMPVCVTSEMNTNEAFTEALTLYCYYNLCSPNKYKIADIDTDPYVQYNIEKEHQYGLNQSAKILNHYDLQISDILKDGQKCFPQESGVFSYYIAKTALLPHINLMLKCITGTSGNYIIDSKKADNLIDLALLDNQFIDKLHRKQYLASNHNIQGKTLRMSLIK